MGDKGWIQDLILVGAFFHCQWQGCPFMVMISAADVYINSANMEKPIYYSHKLYLYLDVFIQFSPARWVGYLRMLSKVTSPASNSIFLYRILSTAILNLAF